MIWRNQEKGLGAASAIICGDNLFSWLKLRASKVAGLFQPGLKVEEAAN
jgi:hypothetical protein